MGHLIPFLQLSKLLAEKGHKIYFVSTPRNLNRLPEIPKQLSSKIVLVSFPLPRVPNLPSFAESSTDVPYTKQQLLKKAFDLLEPPLTTFLESSKPDWIFYDYASHWLPSVAARLGISCAFFSLFTAATLSYIGPPSVLMNIGDPRSKAEDFTVVPKWIPFESDLVFRLHEVTKYVEKTEEDGTGPSDSIRFGFAAGESDVVIIRSSPEFEPEWFNLFKRSAVQKANYTGTEASLSAEELKELALGLENSTLPFFWVLSKIPGSTKNALDMLPDGFQERVKNRGIVHGGWAPQVKILSHDSVGGFMTHCGWNSIIEGLSFGRVLILLPVLNEQGLNSRLLHGKKLGLEIPREEEDGSFTWSSVAELMRTAMVDDSGESLRNRAREIRSMFGDVDRNNCYVARLVNYLVENKKARVL
ncbi:GLYCOSYLTRANSFERASE [Salix koriyanagi]|uniref:GLYCOSYLTRANSFERASE n=1 Tax=Salix koriyanagi TaxID=2511006 RepID=A0A9Q0PUY0_9ROSI|nr:GLYCOSYLTRANSFERASE [Salix koriyanagi]